MSIGYRLLDFLRQQGLVSSDFLAQLGPLAEGFLRCRPAYRPKAAYFTWPVGQRDDFRAWPMADDEIEVAFVIGQ